MRFIITAGPGKDSKPPAADAPFDQALFEAYMKFNEDMAKAGVLVASEGLSGARARVEVQNGKRVVVDGPYAEVKELLGGFYILEVASKEEAVAWALKAPSGMGFDDVLEIFQLTSEGDLPKELAQTIQRVAPSYTELWRSGRR